MTFAELRLAEPLLRSVATEGYSIPTPIQIQAIPLVMEGRDVLGCAQTGTGKTAAFALPILHKLVGGQRQSGSRAPRALVLAPTRELAGQIGESFATYGRHVALRHTVIYGGVSQHSQVQALRSGIDILVATPGRLLDLMNQRHVDLGSVQVLVLDEADQMLDMGFIHDIRRIVSHLPDRRQNLLFSATMPSEIRQLAGSVLRNPAQVQVAPVASTVESVDQSVYFVEKADKPALLQRYVSGNSVAKALVFTRTKHGADRVARKLTLDGISAQAIHGNKSQNARKRAMSNFSSGRILVLVASDIASRGLDIDGISHVINYDMPNVPEIYVHRIGRTARAGASGVAVSFCDREEKPYLKAIEKLTRLAIRVRDDQPRRSPAAPAPKPADRPQSHHRQNGAEPQRSSPGHSSPGCTSGVAVERPQSHHKQNSAQPQRSSPGHSSPGCTSGVAVVGGRGAVPGVNAAQRGRHPLSRHGRRRRKSW
jgi:ATP-dependent RNA helicase RhlE